MPPSIVAQESLHEYPAAEALGPQLFEPIARPLGHRLFGIDFRHRGRRATHVLGPFRHRRVAVNDHVGQVIENPRGPIARRRELEIKRWKSSTMIRALLKSSVG